jgi:hypothetical protein
MDAETGRLIDISNDIAEILKITKSNEPFANHSVFPFAENFRMIGSEELPPTPLQRKNALKYVVLSSKLNAILSELSKEFRLVGHAGETKKQVSLIYYDTPQFRFFHDHLNGKLNRVKIRVKVSGNEGLGFLEIWKRKNRGGVVRQRYLLEDETLECSANQVLMDFSPELELSGVSPVLVARFNRSVLIRDDGKERVTVDTGLEFFKPDGSGPVRSFRNLAFLEMRKVKYENFLLDTLLKVNKIRKQRYSKYCLGVASSYPGVKANLYKPVIRNIEHIISNGYV